MVDDKEKLKIWAAGLFDGEGSALIEKVGKDRSSYQITVAVANTDPRATDPIIQQWGGHHRKNQRPIYKDGSVRKPDFSVYLNLEEARVFLMDILPYLRVKTDDALIVLRAIVEIQKWRKQTGRLRGYSYIIEPFYACLQDIRGLSKVLEPYYIRLKGLP